MWCLLSKSSQFPSSAPKAGRTSGWAPADSLCRQGQEVNWSQREVNISLEALAKLDWLPDLTQTPELLSPKAIPSLHVCRTSVDVTFPRHLPQSGTLSTQTNPCCYVFLPVWKCFWCFKSKIRLQHAVNAVQDMLYWNSLDAVNFQEELCWM